MTHLARFLRSRGLKTAVILPIVAVTFLIVTINTARACWNIILVECFRDHSPSEWPWDPTPNGQGRWWECCIVNGTTYCYPNIPPTYNRWGLHASRFYDVVLCPEDDHSLWCYGWPVGHDPQYDHYPPNYDTYFLFGPFSLLGGVHLVSADQCLDENRRFAVF
jgi:hypothetical protein